MDATTAVSLLLSKPPLRKTLQIQPAQLQQQLNLTNADLQYLRQLDADELERQADCYLDKRFAEAAELIPSTISRIGTQSGDLFREYATRHWPQGHRRHILDAIGFAEFALDRGLAVDVAELRRLKRIHATLVDRNPE